MCSKPKTLPDIFGDEVALAFAMTTHDQRALVAESWGNGKELHIEYAKLLHINPDGLLIASLLEAEHPSICKPSGRPRAGNFSDLLKICGKYVDKSKKSVDNLLKSVEKPVDKMLIRC